MRCFKCREIGYIARNSPQKDDRNNEKDKKQQTKTETGQAQKATLLLVSSPIRPSSVCESMYSYSGTHILLDYGASDHMVPHESWLTEQKCILKKTIVLGDGRRVSTTISGTLTITVFLRGNGETVRRSIQLYDVLFVEELQTSFLSVSKLCKSDCNLKFTRKKCIGISSDGIEFYGYKEGNVYRIDAEPVIYEDAANAARSDAATLQRWHERLGHASIGRIKQLQRSNAVNGMETIGRHETITCESCVKGNQTKSILHTNKSYSRVRGAVIHSDLCGPMSTPSFSKCLYCISFIDEYSGYVKVYPMVKKSDALAVFKIFHP